MHIEPSVREGDKAKGDYELMPCSQAMKGTVIDASKRNITVELNKNIYEMLQSFIAAPSASG